MTATEFLGLLALSGCLCAMGTWLQFQRASTVDRRKKWATFRVSLVMSAGFIGLFGLNFILPAPVPPSLALSICISLYFLLILGMAMNELRIALQARNARSQRRLPDSGT
jgi:hypothetical protein